jgi:hypothetical protein
LRRPLDELGELAAQARGETGFQTSRGSRRILGRLVSSRVRSAGVPQGQDPLPGFFFFSFKVNQGLDCSPFSLCLARFLSTTKARHKRLWHCVSVAGLALACVCRVLRCVALRCVSAWGYSMMTEPGSDPCPCSHSPSRRKMSSQLQDGQMSGCDFGPR